MSDTMNPMPAHATDSPSRVQPDAIRPDVGATPTTGVAPAGHPELSRDHHDAVKARIAAAETDGEFAAFPDASATDALSAHAPLAFAPPSALQRLHTPRRG